MRETRGEPAHRVRHRLTAVFAVADPEPVQGGTSGGSTVSDAIPAGRDLRPGFNTAYALGADGYAYAWAGRAPVR